MSTNVTKMRVKGVTYTLNGKLYNSTGNNIDGSMTQQAITSGLESVKDYAESAYALAEEVREEGKTTIEGNVTNNPDEEDLTTVINSQTNLGELKFKDRAYVPVENAYGYVILRKNQSLLLQLSQTNTIYEIRYKFDLNETTFNVPANCILKFNGGSITNGTLVGNNTKLEGQLDLSLTYSGTFILDHDISPTDFGLILNDNTIDASPYLNKCFELSNISNVGVHIPQGNIYVMDNIYVGDYTTLSIKGDGFKSVVNVYYDFLESNTEHQTRVTISNFKITKINKTGSGYYKGIVFKDFEFRGSVIDSLTVTYFGIFIKGGLHYNTVVENCNVEGLGYSFLSGVYCEDFENNNFYDGIVSQDSSIRNNYINCAVNGSSTNPLPTNRSLIYGFFTSSRFESNFVDFWKCVFDFNGYTGAGRFKGNIIADNFFDRIFSLIIHPICASRISLISNQFFACKKSDNLDGNWSKSTDPEIVNSNFWTMLRLDATRQSNFYIKDNNFDCDLIATVVSEATTTFRDVIIDSNESDESIRDKIIYIPNSVNFLALKASKENFILVGNRIYSTRDPQYSYFSVSYNYVRKIDNNVEIDFGNGYYPFQTTMYKMGYYDYSFVKSHPELIGTVRYTTNQTYALKTVAGEERLVLLNNNNKIVGVESKDIQDMLNNIETDNLEFYTPVLVMDKGVTMSNIGPDAKCYSVLFSSDVININAVKLIADTLPSTYPIINRLILNTSDNKWYRYTYNGWEEDAGLVPIKSIGTTEERPQKYWRTTGTEYYDTDLNAVIVWDGDNEKWKYKDNGYDAVLKVGETSNRPVFEQDTNNGFEFYDTLLCKKILWNGSQWTNLDGTALS